MTATEIFNFLSKRQNCTSGWLIKSNLISYHFFSSCRIRSQLYFIFLTHGSYRNTLKCSWTSMSVGDPFPKLLWILKPRIIEFVCESIRGSPDMTGSTFQLCPEMLERQFHFLQTHVAILVMKNKGKPLQFSDSLPDVTKRHFQVRLSSVNLEPMLSQICGFQIHG